MQAISSYKDLIQFQLNSYEALSGEQWFIFLIMNPRNLTNAGIDIIKNLSYLDARTGHVTFFLPGFSNMNGRIVPYPSTNKSEVVYKDGRFELYFDEIGFLETIKWLENKSDYYKYSEDLDLLIFKQYPVYAIDNKPGLVEQYFDLQNMIVYNLDRLKHEGVNILRLITRCRDALFISMTEREVRQKIDNLIFETSGIVDRHWHQNIYVFVAGSKSLKSERDAVKSAFMSITNNSMRDYAFRVKTFEDFPRSLTYYGRQKDYDDYISDDAEYAIFILDGTVGGITLQEFKAAWNAHNKKGSPEIYVYSHKQSSQIAISKEIVKIKNYVTQKHQYYIEYKDIDDLKNQIKNDFMRYSL